MPAAVQLRKCIVIEILRERFVFLVRDLADGSEHEAVLRGKARILFLRYTVGQELFALARTDGPWFIVTGTQFKQSANLAEARTKLERE